MATIEAMPPVRQEQNENEEELIRLAGRLRPRRRLRASRTGRDPRGRPDPGAGRRAGLPDAHRRDPDRPQRAAGRRRAAGDHRQERRHHPGRHLLADRRRPVQRSGARHRAARQGRAVPDQPEGGADALRQVRPAAARKGRHLPGLRQPLQDDVADRRLSAPYKKQAAVLAVLSAADDGDESGPAADPAQPDQPRAVAAAGASRPPGAAAAADGRVAGDPVRRRRRADPDGPHHRVSGRRTSPPICAPGFTGPSSSCSSITSTRSRSARSPAA